MTINKLKYGLLIILICTLFSGLVCLAEDKTHDNISKKYGFTLEEEQEIGLQATLAIIKKYGYYKNPLVNQYVSNVGETIVRKVSKRPEIKYRFILLDSSEVNAFAAPGGFILITKGTLIVLDNEAELAGVLSHEITHVEEGHGLEAIASDPYIKQKLKQIKTVVTSGDRDKLDLLDQVLKKNQGGSTLVNFEDAVNADHFEEGKIF